MSQHELAKCVTDSLEQYFRDLDGEKPAAPVLICTCTLVMSGTASIGSFW